MELLKDPKKEAEALVLYYEFAEKAVKDCIRKVYRKYRNPETAYLNKNEFIESPRMLDEDDFHDIFIETFAELQKKVIQSSFSIDKIKKGKEIGYLCGIAKIKLMEKIRKRNNEFFKQQEIKKEMKALNAYIGEDIVREEGLSKAEKALNLLREECKELIVLKYLKGLSYKEILTRMKKYASVAVLRNTMIRCKDDYKELYSQLA
ncbi:MAG: hypothetical protein K8R67_02865 [Desulfobacteraceae bacterium]|nr:hypothetical protein [Desulfobacteraceae bacterium]